MRIRNINVIKNKEEKVIILIIKPKRERRFAMYHSLNIAAVNFINVILTIYLYNFGHYEEFYKDTFGLSNTVILPVLLLVISIATNIMISFFFMTLELEPLLSFFGTAVCQLTVVFLLAFIIGVVSIVIAVVVTLILAIAGLVFAGIIIAIIASSC